uniref:J domain-containing protein n=1 Tax=Caldimicrobium thiodismutans TaxID=1653476 RepID=A0A832GRA6_9BACT
MYISRRISPGGYQYSINESYYEEPYFKSRVLVDLGSTPERFITYYSDVAFSIDLEEKLAEKGKVTDQFELEELFFRFLKPEAQRWVKFSKNRKTIKTQELRNYKPEEIHWFDRLRLIVLKLDHREPQRVVNRPFPFYHKLLNKSRDEIENLLWDMEDRLNFRERIRYLLAIFALQRVDNLEDRDRLFLENLCQIASEPDYRMGLMEEEVLSRYLSRYVWFYFDALPWRKVPRVYQTIENSLYQELAYSLHISVEVLLSLSKKEVLKLFRAKILELHPDRGGSHEAFVKIRKLMEDFLKIRF